MIVERVAALIGQTPQHNLMKPPHFIRHNRASELFADPCPEDHDGPDPLFQVQCRSGLRPGPGRCRNCGSRHSLALRSVLTKGKKPKSCAGFRANVRIGVELLGFRMTNHDVKPMPHRGLHPTGTIPPGLHQEELHGALGTTCLAGPASRC